MMTVADFAYGADDSRGRFWTNLSPAERRRLERDGWIETFPGGVKLCSQGERGERVFILRSGQVVIKHIQDGVESILAIRGEDDLLGERAAFEGGERSATVEAQGEVKALVVLADRFNRIMNDFPRLRRLIRDDLYERLTETKPPEPFVYAGQNCTVLMIDISSFNGAHRNDVNRRVVREIMYGELERACRQSNVPWSSCHREDRGDGALMIVPPTVPTASVLHPMCPDLAAAVRRHNLRARDGERFQIRVSVHVGPVTGDSNGMVGEAINMTARLLDARPFKTRLAATGTALGVIVSEFVHGGIVRHLDEPGTWERVRSQVKESRLTGYVRYL
ncbi:hypothetical protein GCM10027589_42700 [Actinocorallia lasiicapitis]